MADESALSVGLSTNCLMVCEEMVDKELLVLRVVKSYRNQSSTFRSAITVFRFHALFYSLRG